MRWLVIALLVVASILGTRGCREQPQRARWHAATFNIEHFPKDSRQADGAFDLMKTLGADLIAVQEITDVELFRELVRRRLSMVFIEEHPPDGTFDHQIGLVFNRDVFAFMKKEVHDDTRLGFGYKPTLEVVLRERTTDEELRVLVVHFKSGGDGHAIRTRQYAALQHIIATIRRSAPEAQVIVLGDFNATSNEDRADLARLAKATRMTWATEDLPCSAFWDRIDSCPTSRLDHVLTTMPPVGVTAEGGCAEVGCETHDRCPLYEEHVSDHCPVVVTFER